MEMTEEKAQSRAARAIRHRLRGTAPAVSIAVAMAICLALAAVVVSLCGCHLLKDGLFVALVARSFESLAVERVEVDAVGLVGDEQIEHGPDEGQAAALAGEAAHHFGAAFDFAERALEQVRNRYERR